MGTTTARSIIPFTTISPELNSNISTPDRADDRLLDAREVAAKLGVSERFVRDHATRRSPRIPRRKPGKAPSLRRGGCRNSSWPNSGRLKTKQSKAPIPVPERVRPVIEAWRKLSKDSSPETLMFPTFGRGERKGQAVPRWGKNFLKWRIRPIARKLGIPDRLVNFQVMRRTLGTDMQQHGTLKDTQGMLRHASIKTTGDVYVQTIKQSVLAAVNSRKSAVLGDWKMPRRI